MSIVLVVLLVIVCAILAFFVLIQNPKGGGLSGSFGGLGNQMMGVKQSTDVVEKGTWVSYIAMVALVLLSFILAPKGNSSDKEKLMSEKAVQGMSIPAPAPQPAPEAATTPAATQSGGATSTQPQAAQGTQPQQVQQPQQAAPNTGGKPMTKEQLEEAMKQAQTPQKK